MNTPNDWDFTPDELRDERPKKCGYCYGLGRREGYRCPDCDGTGREWYPLLDEPPGEDAEPDETPLAVAVGVGVSACTGALVAWLFLQLI